ncbi:DAK2 domain-containing protein [Nocardia asteroides]|uniref:DAK2 domain-containing protein n=1 Tax=Nocardia asteroides TaxID=1824 RepID=UPI001E51C373|nr:DAK2 domain-containing protein [Nocardia asteroides]UGT64895.1 DAK2 domain-containing protein [Nocardia asteroides]
MDGTALLRWGRLCLAGLERTRSEINALNVFPIADADTGTNLLATMRAAMVAAGGAPGADVHAVAAAMARGATAGARGNSGIILSQVLRGIADAVRPEGDRPVPVDAAVLRAALARAAALVRESLSTPVEGTILTVLDAAAAAARACAEHTPVAVAVAAAEGAADALGQTPDQLGVLRAAGVVDAGARGLLVLLDALVELTGGSAPHRPVYRPAPGAATALDVLEPDPLPRQPPRAAACAPPPGRAGSAVADLVGPAPGAKHAPCFEVMYLLSGTDETRVKQLRDRLGELGDSVVVVGDGEQTWSAHVHCADAGAAVEAGMAAGAVRDIRIESFVITAVGPHAPVRTSGPADRGILAVAAGDGAAALFRTAGAIVLPGGAGTITASELLGAIRRMPNREVLVLPNGALPAHELVAVGIAARDADRDVLLLPSGSMVQGMAALAVHDRGRIAVDDAFAMSEAAAGTRWGAVRVAGQRALTMVGTCEPGEGLGLAGLDVVVIERDPATAGIVLLDRMLAFGGELVTLLMGAAAPDGLAAALTGHIEERFSGIEVAVYTGGQPEDLVQIGVE